MKRRYQKLCLATLRGKEEGDKNDVSYHELYALFSLTVTQRGK